MKFVKKATIFLVSVFFIFSDTFWFCCSAASVNSHEVKNGDIIDYEIHAIACPTNVQAVDISVYYDSTSLEYIDGSLKTPAILNSVSNTDLLGEIRLNAITLDGFDFTDDSVLASAKFRVTDDFSSDIPLYYVVKNFLDENKTELNDTYTYDLTIISDTLTVESEAANVSNTAAPEVSISSDVSQPTQQTAESEIITDVGLNNSSSLPNDAPDEKINSIPQDGSEIPDDKAITFDTLDIAQPTFIEKNTHILVMASVAGIIILIAVVIVLLIKNSDNNGGHFS